jgi:predicted nucleotidyltransferase
MASVYQRRRKMKAGPHSLEPAMSVAEHETLSSPDAVLVPLCEVLSHFPAIGLAVLFGSVASGRARANSDLDLAVSPGRVLTASEMVQLTQALAAETGRPVNLTDLASVSVPLLGQIVRYGRWVQGSAAEFGQLINRHLIEQADFMPLRNRVLAERRTAWIGGDKKCGTWVGVVGHPARPLVR